MKKILPLLCAVAVLCGKSAANTNTNFVATAQSISLSTTAMIQDPTNFAAANALLVSSNLTVGYTNVAGSFSPSNSSARLIINTNCVSPQTLSNGLVLITVSNLTVNFGTNVFAFAGSMLTINSQTGRTADVIAFDPVGLATNTLKFRKGILVDP